MSSSFSKAKKRAKEYLGKNKADNIVIDTHASSYGLASDEEGTTITKKNIDNYPKKTNPTVKTQINGLIGISELLKDGGNLVFLSCNVTKGEGVKEGEGGSKGKVYGKKLSMLLPNKNVLLTPWFCPKGAVSAIKFKGKIVAYATIETNLKGFQLFNSGAFKGTVDIQITTSNVFIK